jgi:hypothetical protein
MAQTEYTGIQIRFTDKPTLEKLADSRGCSMVDFFSVLLNAWGRLSSEDQTAAIVEALHPEPANVNSSPAS